MSDNPEAWINPPPGTERERQRRKGNGRNGTQVGRLRVLSVDDLLALPPRDYLVKGVFAPGELSLLVGAKNTFKTFTGLHIDYGLAQGWPTILGRRAKQTPALYMIAEGEFGIGNRVKGLVSRYGRCDAFHVVTQSIDLLRSTATAGDLRDVIEIVRRFGIGKVSVDTISRAMMGGDENSSVDMGTLLTNLNLLRHETGAHVMGIHHGTQAEGTKSRGHSTLPYGVDVILQAERSDAQAIGSLTVGFCRDDAIGPLVTFRTELVALGKDADGDAITTLVIEEGEPGKAPAKGKGRSADPMLGRLGTDARLMFSAIKNLFVEGCGEHAVPQTGMARIEVLRRQAVRARNISEGWFNQADLVPLVSNESKLTTDRALTHKGQDHEHRALKALKAKELIGFTSDWIWLVRGPQS
jgi:hypothetical protein